MSMICFQFLQFITDITMKSLISLSIACKLILVILWGSKQQKFNRNPYKIHKKCLAMNVHTNKSTTAMYRHHEPHQNIKI